MSETVSGFAIVGRKRIIASSVMILFANLLACTEYIPVRGALDVGSAPEVRVDLSDQGRLNVSQSIGPRVNRLEGVLQSMNDSSLTLSVRKVQREGGIEDSYQDLQLTLSSRDYDTLEKGRVSKPRSLLLAGSIIVSAFLIARGAGDISGGRTGGPPPPTR
jgi:hypothetical protein